jgi:hypothetical protein
VALASDCNGDERDHYSDPATVVRSKFGDVAEGNGFPVVPCGRPQGVVDFVDISSIRASEGRRSFMRAIVIGFHNSGTL